MTSIFDLKTSAAQLPSINQGLAELEYQQVDSTAPVSGASFPSSTKRYRFDVADSTWWIPSRSYIRARVKYYGVGGAVALPAIKPTRDDDIAPNMGTMGNLFQTLQFDINNKTVSKIEDNVAQIDALLTRMNNSKSWIDSIGEASNYWQPSFADRQKKICQVVDFDDPNSYTVTSLIGLAGMAAATTIAIAVNGTVTFANAGGNTDTFLQIGDILRFAEGGSVVDTEISTNGLMLQITGVANARTCTAIVVNNTGDQLPPIVLNPGVALQSARIGGSAAASGVMLLRAKADNPHAVIEYVWRPPLSIFQIPNALPAGQYQLSLTPQTADRYQKAAIESLVGDQSAPADFGFEVQNMYLYVCTVKSDRVDNITYYMSLDEVNCQPLAVGAGTSAQKAQLDVVPSTYRLSVAFQDQGITADTTKSASKFKFYGANAVETDLNQLYIQYAGQTIPSPYADPEYVASTYETTEFGTDFLNQRYIESALYSGLYYNLGGAETKQEWIDRGPYYTFSWPKDGTSESTRVYVTYKFANAPVDGEANLLVFSHYKQVVAVTISNGRVSSVQQQLG